MQATIDIDPKLLQAAEEVALRRGQPLSILIEDALRDSIGASKELYGEPLTDDDIDEAGRVTFDALDEDEGRSKTR